MRFTNGMSRLEIYEIFDCDSNDILNHDLDEIYARYEKYMHDPHIGEIYENEKGEKLMVTNAGNGDGLFYGVKDHGKPISTFDGVWHKTGKRVDFFQQFFRP